MEIVKEKDKLNFDVTITPNDGHNWSNKDRLLIEEHAKMVHSKRSAERILKNRLLAVLYRMEEYLNDESIEIDEISPVEAFVNDFCAVLGLGKKEFAGYLDLDISNLNKYLKGQRGFSSDLAMKLSRFFHTPVDIWLKIQLKNDLILLHAAEKVNKYEKYDYTQQLKMAY